MPVMLITLIGRGWSLVFCSPLAVLLGAADSNQVTMRTRKRTHNRNGNAECTQTVNTLTNTHARAPAGRHSRIGLAGKGGLTTRNSAANRVDASPGISWNKRRSNAHSCSVRWILVRGVMRYGSRFRSGESNDAHQSRTRGLYVYNAHMFFNNRFFFLPGARRFFFLFQGLLRSIHSYRKTV